MYRIIYDDAVQKMYQARNNYSCFNKIPPELLVKFLKKATANKVWRPHFAKFHNMLIHYINNIYNWQYLRSTRDL